MVSIIKYFVRTTGERKFNYDLKYNILLDKDKKPVDSFISQLEYISKWNSVLLEDDIILCRNFKDRIEKVIEEFPNTIINFFTAPKEYFKTDFAFIFYYTQCTYYPKGISKIIADKMKQLRPMYSSYAYDCLENVALKKLGIKTIRYRPSLVQHIDDRSIISGIKFHNYRRTPFFIDYLEELGINYEEANTRDNRDILEKKLVEEFKEIDKR